MIQPSQNKLDTNIHQSVVYTNRLTDLSLLDKELNNYIRKVILDNLNLSKNKFFFKKEDDGIMSPIKKSNNLNLIINDEFHTRIYDSISIETDDLLINKYKDLGFILLGKAFGKNVYLGKNVPINTIYLTNDITLYKSSLLYDDLNKHQIKRIFNLKLDKKSQKIIIIQGDDDPNRDEWIHYKRRKNLTNMLNK